MKIGYDTTVLGQGYINSKARTGIYRVVESLFQELIKIPTLEINAISFNQQHNIWDEISSKLYFYQQDKDNVKYLFYPSYKSRFNLDYLYTKSVKIQKNLINNFLDKNDLLYKLCLALQIPFKIIGKVDMQLNTIDKSYDLYHSPFYALPPKAKDSRVIRAITIYDLIPIIYPEKFTKKIYSQFLNTINSIDLDLDWVICISENTKNDFCEYTNMNPDRVFVTPLAAADHFYHVKEKQLINSTISKYNIPQVPYILSLCTLEPRKNLSFLIQCFSEIIADNPSLELNLVLVGVNGWKNNAIFKAAGKNPDLSKRIIFTGYVPDEDLSAIYSGATAFVYPSLYEGFGLPPLEAMQCGTPVISSNTSSLPEVVGNAGITINPKDKDELCQALLNIINDSNLRDSLSKKGIARAKRFSWKKCAEETIKVYQLATS
ncbi:MAG: glycosyltransferase family 1 protein [Xenococcaceae cyanobacterium MO_167.B27]|nr:glycosyltransferase family 1 protein [Xenococcaceae cyanobacterium MO_167.B27]